MKLKSNVCSQNRHSIQYIDKATGRTTGFRFPAGNLSVRHRAQTGSGAHLASYQMGTGGKAVGALS
jgi:hypothetical protein